MVLLNLLRALSHLVVDFPERLVREWSDSTRRDALHASLEGRADDRKVRGRRGSSPEPIPPPAVALDFSCRGVIAGNVRIELGHITAGLRLRCASNPERLRNLVNGRVLLLWRELQEGVINLDLAPFDSDGWHQGALH